MKTLLRGLLSIVEKYRSIVAYIKKKIFSGFMSKFGYCNAKKNKI